MRLPDFLIIGAMKSATTSLYHWLDQQPGCVMPHASRKEPDFFSRDEVWERGTVWYSRIFADFPAGCITGEASVSYTGPAAGAVAAERIARTLPHARLIYVLRNPVDRLRSHYRHEIQRSRERRPLGEAVREPGNAYVGHSLYHARLAPYVDAFDRDQLCVVRMDDLVGEDLSAWHQVLAHLGLPPADRPPESYNVTSEKAGFTPLLLRIWERYSMDWTKRLPGPVRRLGRRTLTREGDEYDRELQGADAPVPDEVVALLAEDAAALAAALGIDRPLWDLTDAR